MQITSASHGSLSKDGIDVKRLTRARMRTRGLFRKTATTSVVAVVIVVAIGICVSPAGAVEPGPGWSISAVAQPTNFSAGRDAECSKAVEEAGVDPLLSEASRRCDRYVITARNEGSQPSTAGDPITIKDILPEDVKAVSVDRGRFLTELPSKLDCELATVSCTYDEQAEGKPIEAGGALVMVVDVEVLPGAPASVASAAVVSGGGAAAVSASLSTIVSAAPPGFGVSDFSFGAFGVDGAPDLQAGDRPNAVTANLQFSTVTYREPPESVAPPDYQPVESPKDIVVDLPLGFVGNPQTTPRCPEYLVSSNGCPAGSRVGTLEIANQLGGSSGLEQHPVFNVLPERGYPAEFGFEELGREFVMYASVVHTPSGYRLRVAIPGVIRWKHNIELTGFTVTFFGDPAVADGGSASAAAFSTNPTDCSMGALRTKVEVDSWQDPGVYISKETTTYPQVTGCDMLQFQPTIALQPETTQADAPSGYNVDLEVPQALNIAPVPATPELRDAVVTLPEGVSVSPSAAGGLAGCEESGPEGIDMPSGERPANQAGQGETIGADGLSHLTSGHCPAGSTLGTVELTTPLLAEPLKGHLFLAQPKCGGEGQSACTEASAANGELYGVYLEAGAEAAGVVIKLKGSVSVNPSTGQVTTTFKENPQFPFSDLKVHLNGGDRAPLANPQTCATFTMTSNLTPWSAPVTPDATPSSSFPITGCGSAMPFAPLFSAGVVTANAAASSPFTLTFSRHDGEQDFSALSVTTPPGLVGMLSQVPLCGEPQAAAGTCPEASRIGATTVAAGAGSQPFWISGKVYLTGPYNGAPFGLSVVVPAKAGPFNLGNVIVRSAINVDPKTSALTVTSGPLPQMKDGVPFRLKTVNVTIDRPGFMLNPTNCEPQSITGTIAATQGVRASVSSPFAVGGCKSLPFKPSFTVSTQAKTSKANGASLDVKVSYPPSGQANIKSVKVDLPVQLPSRLTTLQKACVAAVFESNPARCPPESIVGIAKAQTPVLPVTLTGPAYLVSHAAAAFPDLVVILQGEGVRVDLTGNTLIKKGVTSSTFRSIPDVPVSSFELYLPEGKYSVLAAYGNLCMEKLQMPTAITGQNGAEIHESTRIEVKGCSKTLSIQSHSIKKRTLTLSVYVPSAGKLTASGKGLSKTSKSSTGPETLKLTLKTTKGGRLMARINLTFSPKKGTKQAKSFSVRFG
jgi:hypothetical protein